MTDIKELMAYDYGKFATPEQAIAEVLDRAYHFDDKPHQLFSALMKLAMQYSTEAYTEEIMESMNQAYEKIGEAREVWEDVNNKVPR